MPATQSTNPEDARAVRDGEREAETAPAPKKPLTAATLDKLTRQGPFWVPLPELGEGLGVYVRQPSSGDRMRWEMRRQEEDEEALNKMLSVFRETLVLEFACDEDGRRIFEDGDLAKLQDLPAPAVARAAERIIDLMGWGADDVEELEKN